MDAKLIVVGGKADKRELRLKLPMVIGRSRDADLTVAHSMISRQHCKLYEVDGLLMVRDLGSLNGTTVNDEPVKESPLKPDDEFTIGPLTFRASYDYAGDPGRIPEPAPSPPKPPVVDGPARQPAYVDDETPYDPHTVGEPLPDVPAVEDVPDFLFMQEETPAGEDEPLPDLASWEPDAQQAAVAGTDTPDEDAGEIVEVAEDEVVADELDDETTTITAAEFSISDAAANAEGDETEGEEPEPMPPPMIGQPLAVDAPTETRAADDASVAADSAEELDVDQIEMIESSGEIEPPAAASEEAPAASTGPDLEAWEEIQSEAAEDLITGSGIKPRPPKKRRWPFGRKSKPEPESPAETPAPQSPWKAEDATADDDGPPPPASNDDDLGEFLKGLP